MIPPEARGNAGFFFHRKQHGIRIRIVPKTHLLIEDIKEAFLHV